MNTERCRREEGHNSYSLECRLSAGKLFPAKTTKILSTRNSSILMMSSSEYLFLESECSFTKYVFSCPIINTKYLYLRLPFFENEGVSDNTGESVFQFLVRYGCIKSGKIKRLDACNMVEGWRFKMF